MEQSYYWLQKPFPKVCVQKHNEKVINLENLIVKVVHKSSQQKTFRKCVVLLLSTKTLLRGMCAHKHNEKINVHKSL